MSGFVSRYIVLSLFMTRAREKIREKKIVKNKFLCDIMQSIPCNVHFIPFVLLFKINMLSYSQGVQL